MGRRKCFSVNRILSPLRISSVLFVLVCVWATHLLAQEIQLKGSEIQALLSEIEGVSGTSSGYGFTAYYSDQGTLRVKLPHLGRTLRGTWWVDGDRYCRQFQGQATQCQLLYKAGENSYVSKSLDGKLLSRWAPDR